MNRGAGLLLTLTLCLATAGAVAGEPEEVSKSLRAIEQLREQGNVEAAAKRASDLVASHPEDLEAHVAHQDLQLALGHDKDLLDQYRSASRAADATADAHYLYARLLRGAPAVAELRAALKANEHHFWALCALGGELVAAKAFDEAADVLARARTVDLKSGVPVNALGRLEEARGRSADAEKLYRRAIELAPELMIARVNLGVVLVGMGKPDDAMVVLNDAASRAPKDPMPLLGLGMAYMSQKQPKAALPWFEKAVALDGNSVYGLNLLANAYINLDQLDLAAKAIDRALTLAPQSVATLVNAAYLRLANGELEPARLLATKATQLDDTSADARYVLGLVYDRQGSPKKAEIEFHKAERLDDANPLYARALAAVLREVENWRDALVEYQRVVKLTGGSTESLMDLALAFEDAERPKNAASTYEQVNAAEPGCLDAWLRLGRVCHADLRDYKRAAKAYHEYLKRGGTDARVAGWLAEIEEK